MFAKKQIIPWERLPRGRYWLYDFFLSVIFVCINIIFPYENIIKTIFVIPFVFFDIYLKIKRLHDLDRSGLHIFYLLVPFYQIYLIYILRFKRGTYGNNKYGEDPILFKEINKNKLKKVL